MNNMDKLYKVFISSKVDYVKFIKEYMKSPDKAEYLKMMDKNTKMTINEKMLVYLFLDKIVLERKLVVRKCKKCKFEWFSTDCDAIHCEKCR